MRSQLDPRAPAKHVWTLWGTHPPNICVPESLLAWSSFAAIDPATRQAPSRCQNPGSLPALLCYTLFCLFSWVSILPCLRVKQGPGRDGCRVWQGRKPVSACGLLGSEQERTVRAGKVTEGIKDLYSSHEYHTTGENQRFDVAYSSRSRPHSMMLSGKSKLPMIHTA